MGGRREALEIGAIVYSRGEWCTHVPFLPAFSYYITSLLRCVSENGFKRFYEGGDADVVSW